MRTLRGFQSNIYHHFRELPKTSFKQTVFYINKILPTIPTRNLNDLHHLLYWPVADLGFCQGGGPLVELWQCSQWSAKCKLSKGVWEHAHLGNFEKIALWDWIWWLFLLKSANYLIKLSITTELKTYCSIDDRLKISVGAQAPLPRPPKSAINCAVATVTEKCDSSISQQRSASHFTQPA